MRKTSNITMMLCLLIVWLLFLAACAPAAAPVPSSSVPVLTPAPKAAAPAPQAAAMPAWQAEWERMLEAAKAETTLSILSSAGSEPRVAISEAIRKTYGLRTEIVGGAGGQLAERLLRERRAGIYSADVLMAGSSTYINTHKPAGVLTPLEPVLVLSDAKNPNVWWKGRLPWVDKDHMVLGTLGEPEPAITVNTNLVQPGEVKVYKDLLDPKWKGRITLRDVSVAGGGGKWFSIVMQSGILSVDYMRQLAKQEPVIIQDGRLQAEWLAQGKYAIGIATQGSVIEPMLELGVPLRQLVPAEGTYLASGSTCLALINRAPHPNAAKVFINWFLTKEGQTLVSRAMGSQSRRLDVPTDHLRPSSLRQPGIEYVDSDNEEFILKEPELRKQAKEIFGIK